MMVREVICRPSREYKTFIALHCNLRQRVCVGRREQKCGA
jgi:hypothetical protein